MKNYPLAMPQVTAQDIQAVTEVLQSHTLSRGPIVDKFEAKFCAVTDSKYACAVSSGSAGLIMALQALKVSAGDEVITVSFTVSATVNSILAIGAIPVMVDIEKQSLGMCPQAMQLAITNKTKAIVVVHAFGQSAQMHEILKAAKKHGLKVVEDACEAVGNFYQNKALGTQADIGVFAFYPNKQITTGEGGMLITNNPNLQAQFQVLRNHGRSMNGDLYDQISFGWNFRMSDINAALGLSQMKRLQEITKKRRQIADFYTASLAKYVQIITPQFSKNEQNSAWFVYVVRLIETDRDKVREKLQQQGIQCGRYFAPVHLQPYYQKIFPNTHLKNTETIAQQSLALPFYLQLNEKDVTSICTKLISSL